MRPSRVSSYIVGGVLGALIATGLFDGPLSLASAAQFFRPAPIADAPVTNVDRSHKGDRLTVSHPDTSWTTTIALKRKGAPGLGGPQEQPSDPRLVPASLKECEPLASPYADPTLGRFAARCFV